MTGGVEIFPMKESVKEMRGNETIGLWTGWNRGVSASEFRAAILGFSLFCSLVARTGYGLSTHRGFQLGMGRQLWRMPG